MLAAIIKKQRFGASLAFVITGPRANRVYIAPIIFGLRVHDGIAVNLGRGRLKNLGAGSLGQTQHVDGAMHTGFDGLHRIVLIVHRAGGAGQVVNLINLDIKRKCHVVAHHL